MTEEQAIELRQRYLERLEYNEKRRVVTSCEGVKATASVIFLARTGSTKAEIKAYIEENFGYDRSRTCDEICPNYYHGESCQETAPEAIAAFLEGESFEDVSLLQDPLAEIVTH